MGLAQMMKSFGGATGDEGAVAVAFAATAAAAAMEAAVAAAAAATECMQQPVEQQEHEPVEEDLAEEEPTQTVEGSSVLSLIAASLMGVFVGSALTFVVHRAIYRGPKGELPLLT